MVVLRAELKALSDAMEQRSCASAFQHAMQQLHSANGDQRSEEHAARLSEAFATCKPATISEQDEATIRNTLMDLETPRELGQAQSSLAVKFAELLQRKTASDDDALLLLRAAQAKRAVDLKTVVGGPVPAGGAELELARAQVLQFMKAARDMPVGVAPLCSTVEQNLSDQVAHPLCVNRAVLGMGLPSVACSFQHQCQP